MRKKKPKNKGDSKKKYNLGGYIPANQEKEKPVLAEEFGSANFVDFLRTRKSDFVFDLIVDEELEKINRKTQDAERLRMMRSEEEKKFYEALKEKKRVERDRMLRFEKGNWNPGVLDYLAEIHDRDIDFGYLDALKEPLTKQIGKGSAVRLFTPEAGMGDQTQAKEDNEGEASDDDLKKIFGMNTQMGSSLDLLGPSKRAELEGKTFPLRPAESLVDVPNTQGELESIWQSLKLPLDQKLDMAIKYSSPKFALKLEMVFHTFLIVGDYVMEIGCKGDPRT
jgi:hypothetical protein